MSQYIDRKAAERSYRPKAGTMSPGLKRAREPYRIRNALTGIILGAFTAGVWAYSISAVKQDVFDDVDEEVKALRANEDPSHSSPSPSPIVGAEHALAAAVHQEEHIVKGAIAALEGKPLPDDRPLADIAVSRGVLQRLHDRHPWLLDPEQKTIVWGAPPVDNIGKIRRQ